MDAIKQEIERLMVLVDDYADAFHAAMRSDGGIQLADGYIAKVKKDAIRTALRNKLVETEIMEIFEDRS